MERRVCLSTIRAVPAGGSSGVDDLALGDVNVDRFADVAVASHQGGHFLVTIYSGGGTPGKTQTGYDALPLVTLTDPLGAGVGPLSIALGDFDGDGSSDLAIASTATGSGSSSQIATYSFTLTQNSPYNAPVTAVALASPFTAPTLGSSPGLALAAADFDGLGPDELVVAPTGAGATTVDIMSFQSSAWTVTKSLTSMPVNKKMGLNVAAGDVTGDGTPDVVVSSDASGQVTVYDPSLSRWVWTTSPLGKNAKNIRPTVVENHGASGAIVVSGTTAKGTVTNAIAPWQGRGPIKFTPAQSPGSGPLVPLGAGYVYQRSSIKDPTSAFPTSDGPVTPTVLFASNSGSTITVQGFTSKNTPSRPDTYSEPLTAGTSAAGFTPLQARKDAATGGNAKQATDLPADSSVPSNLIAYPTIDYTSPYSIDLTAAPSSIYDGLFPYTSITAKGGGAWGPNKVANTPPTIPTGAGTTWLQQRVLAAYASYIGVDYQHHHDATWTPEQGSSWNLTSTVGYQSQGIDCTNFTALAYTNALGITINSDTSQQALISQSNLNGTIIPPSLASSGLISVQAIDKSQWSSYQEFVALAQPGDILIINGSPSDPSQATHAITWLGTYGVDKNGQDKYLIIDSTGTNPDHIDSNNQVVPQGVHIRPCGAPGSSNEWYFNHVDHILRIIAS